MVWITPVLVAIALLYGLWRANSILVRLTNTLDKTDTILNAVQQSVPQILEQTQKATSVLPQTVEDAQKAAAALPKLMDDAQKLMADVQKIVDSLPKVVSDVQTAAETFPGIANNIKVASESVPPIMQRLTDASDALPEMANQLKAAALAIPPIVNQAQEMTEVLGEFTGELKQLQKVGQVAPQSEGKNFIELVSRILELVATLGEGASLFATASGIKPMALLQKMFFGSKAISIAEWLIGVRTKAMIFAKAGESVDEIIKVICKNKWGTPWMIQKGKEKPIALEQWVRSKLNLND